MREKTRVVYPRQKMESKAAIRASMTANDPPRVTVFIPVYNREAYIGAAIESILGQSFSRFELLLVDDGSTDRSVEVLRSYDDLRIRVVCNAHNRGIPHTRNRGLELARGEYIALLDSDDIAQSDRLQHQVAFLDRHSDTVQVGGWVRRMDATGRLLKKVKRQPTTPDEVRTQLLFRCSLSNTTIMARTAVLREYGYRPNFPRCQDYDLHVRLAKRHKMANIPRILTHARVHPAQITARTPQLGDTKKEEIIRRQLTDLGVTCRPQDLSAHLTLSRMRKFQIISDRTYLDWADAWLQGLLEANGRTRHYPASVFQRAVSAKWAHACLAASQRLGWTAWRRFLRSPLRKGIGSHLLRTLPMLLR